LHDGLGQHLAGIAFKAKVLEEDLAGESSRLTGDAEKIVALVNDAIQQTRNLARGLDPVDFEVSGLPAALQSLALQTEKLFNIECLFSCNEERLTLGAQTNVALYRIAQEAISNAIKHGQARRIEIDLNASQPQLSLTIRDNGQGFLLGDKSRHGMGLRIMGYRTDTLGGVLSIHSEVAVGTQIKCVLPNGLP
jgi:signal transduction histidine kinase